MITSILSLVHPREPCSIYQVLCWLGDAVPLPHSRATGQLHILHAFVAAGNLQVRKEDSILRWHVDSPAAALVLPLC